jgi:hypothetical protein
MDNAAGFAPMFSPREYETTSISGTAGSAEHKKKAMPDRPFFFATIATSPHRQRNKIKPKIGLTMHILSVSSLH